MTEAAADTYEAIVGDLADHGGPIGYDTRASEARCLLCSSPGPGLASIDSHRDFCPWRRARQMRARAHTAASITIELRDVTVDWDGVASASRQEGTDRRSQFDLALDDGREFVVVVTEQVTS
jgi:hypothetical protein